ncbi:MAG: hypothetical protein H5T64_11985 [Chloroflexi bacterium]|nr:hypothetical protein [Chloroflexota bacterium]
MGQLRLLLPFGILTAPALVVKIKICQFAETRGWFSIMFVVSPAKVVPLFGSLPMLINVRHVLRREPATITIDMHIINVMRRTGVRGRRVEGIQGMRLMATWCRGFVMPPNIMALTGIPLV